MDTLTHVVTGALMARIAAPDRRRHGQPDANGWMLAGGTAAIFPDLDFGLRLADTLTYLNWHQGPTHSLVLLPLWALPLAWLCAYAGKRRYRWQAFYLPVCLGIAIHIAVDALTAYGPMLLSPFSDQRYFVPWLYLLDPLFTAIAISGLAAVVFLPHGRFTALAALLLLTVYALWQGRLHEQAVDAGVDYAHSRSFEHARIHALPQPLSPFNWKVIVDHEDVYYEGLIDLYEDSPATSAGSNFIHRLDAAFKPPAGIVWRPHERAGTGKQALPRQAWRQPELAPFRRFAMFPVLDHVERKGDGVCVWFADLRFSLPLIPTSYRFGLCRDHDGDDWRLERLRGAFWID